MQAAFMRKKDFSKKIQDGFSFKRVIKELTGGLINLSINENGIPSNQSTHCWEGMKNMFAEPAVGAQPSLLPLHL